MEYLEISDGKMLLSLSADDMAEYRGSRKTAIRRLMLDLHEKYGCRQLSGRIYVQMYESKSGGCELFVTKLDDKAGEDHAMMRQTEDRMMTEYRRYIVREVRGVYRFGEMNDLLFACRLLTESGYSGKSEAYADRDKGEYYIVLDGESVYAAEALGALCPEMTEYYLREHCTKLFGDRAAQLLGALV